MINLKKAARHAPRNGSGHLFVFTFSYSPRAMRDADVRTLTQRLVHDTVTFSEADKSDNLVFGGVCRKIKVQPDALKPNRCVFGYPERAAKI